MSGKRFNGVFCFKLYHYRKTLLTLWSIFCWLLCIYFNEFKNWNVGFTRGAFLHFMFPQRDVRYHQSLKNDSKYFCLKKWHFSSPAQKSKICEQLKICRQQHLFLFKFTSLFQFWTVYVFVPKKNDNIISCFVDIFLKFEEITIFTKSSTFSIFNPEIENFLKQNCIRSSLTISLIIFLEREVV